MTKPVTNTFSVIWLELSNNNKYTYRAVAVVHVVEGLQIMDVLVTEVAVAGQLVPRGAGGRVEVSADEVRVEVTSCVQHQLLDGRRHLVVRWCVINKL